MNAVNLVPLPRLERRRYKRRLRVWLAVCSVHAAVLLCSGTAYSLLRAPQAVITGQDLDHAQHQLARLRTSIIGAQAETARALAAVRASREITDQPDWTALLKLVGGRLGDGAVLDVFQVRPAAESPGGVGAAGKAMPGQRRFLLLLRGHARTQAEVTALVLRLQEMALFDEVTLARTVREPFQGGEAVGFQVYCQLSEDRGGP